MEIIQIYELVFNEYRLKILPLLINKVIKNEIIINENTRTKLFIFSNIFLLYKYIIKITKLTRIKNPTMISPNLKLKIIKPV